MKTQNKIRLKKALLTLLEHCSDYHENTGVCLGCIFDKGGYCQTNIAYENGIPELKHEIKTYEYMVED